MVLILFSLILITVAFFKALNTPEGVGQNAILVTQTNQEITCFQSYFQIFAIRTAQFTGTTFALPDPTTMRLGASITVRNVSDSNLSNLNTVLQQVYSSGTNFVDGGTRNSILVRGFDGFSEVIQGYSGDGSTEISQTYLVAKGPDGIQRWYHAGVANNTL